jgi:hypothetical protein
MKQLPKSGWSRFRRWKLLLAGALCLEIAGMTCSSYAELVQMMPGIGIGTPANDLALACVSDKSASGGFYVGITSNDVPYLAKVVQGSIVSMVAVPGIIQGIALDSVGDVMAVGNVTNSGSSTLFISRYSPIGIQIWSRQFGTNVTSFGNSVVADSSGNIWVTGSFSGSIDFGTGPMTSNGSTDVYLAKLTLSGTTLFANHYGDANQQTATGIAIDSVGNVILTGTVFGSINFGGAGVTSAGSSDVYIAKLAPTGFGLWAKGFGDASAHPSTGLAIGPSDSILLAGTFAGTINFGGGPLSAAGSQDGFLAKLDSNGNYVWSRSVGGMNDSISAFALDSNGNIAVAGTFTGSINLGQGVQTSAGSADVFIARYQGADGSVGPWSFTFGSVSTDTSHALAYDANNTLMAVGEFTANMNLGGASLTNAGGSDVYLARIAQVPVFDSVTQAGGSLDLHLTGVPSITYTVQVTTNLNPANWQNWTNVTASNSGADVMDSVDPNTPQRFYRAVWTP